MKTVEDIKQSQVKDNAFIHPSDLIAQLGQAGVLLAPTVFPFYYQLEIANGVDSKENFREMQNTLMQQFTLESDGELTVTSNLLKYLANSEDLTLTGKLEMRVPVGTIFPLDFVPEIKYVNGSGSARKLSFYGWLSPYPVQRRI